MVICDNVDIDNCIEVANLGVAMNSKLIRETVHKFLINNMNELTRRKDLFKLPRSTFISLLESDDLVLLTSKGNVVPGASVQRVPEPDPIPGISFATRPDPIQF